MIAVSDAQGVNNEATIIETMKCYSLPLLVVCSVLYLLLVLGSMSWVVTRNDSSRETLTNQKCSNLEEEANVYAHMR